MRTLKTIVTLSWKFESDKNEEECLKYAKSQLEEILNTNPQGNDFADFNIQMDLVKMKDRKRIIHLGSFELEDVFPFITFEETRKEYKVGDHVYYVKMNSDRYHVFKNNIYCESCGLKGKKMILDMHHGDSSPHFNMYGEENGRLILMTKDHKIPKSKNGTDDISNLRTMCLICNNIRGNYDLTLEQINQLKILYSQNPDRLPKKELSETINKMREKF